MQNEQSEDLLRREETEKEEIKRKNERIEKQKIEYEKKLGQQMLEDKKWRETIQLQTGLNFEIHDK